MSLISKVIRKAAVSQRTLPLKDYFGRKLRETYYNAEVLHRIDAKTAPLSFRIQEQAPARINLLIPEINFHSLYGGYLAKFNLALRLVQAGYRVRLVIVDPCVFEPDNWRQSMHQYQGIEDLFDRVEVAYQGDRSEILEISPSDRFIATTWWTAYLADHVSAALNGPPFVYLIQEYEPFTFPMGSYFAMAEHSYTFNHYAMFSSRLLQEYFEIQGIGVYAENSDQEAEKSVFFENAIVSFSREELERRFSEPVLESRSGRKRLLFYARPEAHATRNMFEVAFLALSRSIRNGVFDPSWEFHGIGSRHGDIELPDGRKLIMLGKFGLNEYKQRLLDYDLGLSLMYTPHPSLLPLDMAAAGMVVVTNSCDNKTDAKLKALSPNLIGADPHIDGVCVALDAACAVSADLVGRQAGAQVAWAKSWEDTFHNRLMERLDQWLA